MLGLWGRMPIFVAGGRPARLRAYAPDSINSLLQTPDLLVAARDFLDPSHNEHSASQTQPVISVVQCEIARVSFDQVGFLSSDQATTCAIAAAWCQQSRLCSLAHLDTSSATLSAIESLTEACSPPSAALTFCSSRAPHQVSLAIGYAATKHLYCGRIL